jgi:hypothetical protein
MSEAQQIHLTSFVGYHSQGEEDMTKAITTHRESGLVKTFTQFEYVER